MVPLAVLTLVALTGAVAAAQEEPAGDARERALDLFEEAERAYQEGRVEEAVELLVGARAIYPEPVLLYNLARAQEALGRLDDALASYRGYLEERPDAEDRGAIESRIASIERQIAERERLERERLEAESRAEESRRGPPAVAFVLAGVGAAALGTGVALSVIAEGHRDDANRDPVHRSAVGTFAQAEDEALAANVLFAAGGALVVAGVVWLVVHLLRDD